jgi:hypothetical protein
MVSPNVIEPLGGREPQDIIKAMAYIIDRALGVDHRSR